MSASSILAGDAASSRRAEIGLEHGQHRFQHGDARQAHGRAALVDTAGKVLIDDRVEDNARLLLDVLEHFRYLLFGADERIDMLDGARILVLRGSRSAGCQQRFTGGIGNQVKVKEALGFVHRGSFQAVGRCG
jgi:hypothetical protein